MQYITMFVNCHHLRLTAPNSISTLAAPHRPPGGAYSAPRCCKQSLAIPLAVFKGSVSKAREGKGEKMGRVGEEWREGPVKSVNPRLAKYK